MVSEPSRQDVGEHARATDQLMLLEHHAGTPPVRADVAARRDRDSFDDDTPRVGVTRPFSARSRVDLPAPDAPRKTVKTPGFEAKRRRRKRTRSGWIDDFDAFDLDHYAGQGHASAVPSAYDSAMTPR